MCARQLLALLSLLLLSAAACGARVVVDGDAAAGGAGGGGPAPASCTDLCNAQEADGCIAGFPGYSIDICLFGCEYARSNAASCVDAYDASLACAAAHPHAPPAVCIDDGSCSALGSAYRDCVFHGACEVPESCTPDGCTATCGGVTYRTTCGGIPPKACSCLVNGATLGSCQPPSKDSSYPYMALTVGCCTPFFEASE